MPLILGIDPGNEESAYALLDEDLKPRRFAKQKNNDVMFNCLDIINSIDSRIYIAIEMVASYGMPVGREVFDTCVMIGRFAQALNSREVTLIYRKDEKITLCGSMKAKDSNIRQALIDRFGPIGTKKDPGWFYGVHRDIWSAIAVGVTFHDMYTAPQIGEKNEDKR